MKLVKGDAALGRLSAVPLMKAGQRWRGARRIGYSAMASAVAISRGVSDKRLSDELLVAAW
jgi:hypothetical protein